MTEFKRGDWFQFKPEFEPEHVELGEKFRVSLVAENIGMVSYLDTSGTDWETAHIDHIVKVEDPNPKLTAALSKPSPFVKPEEVQSVFGRADAIISPSAENEHDWERLHSLEDELYVESFRVMLEYKDYREEILRKMLEVADLKIPKW